MLCVKWVGVRRDVNPCPGQTDTTKFHHKMDAYCDRYLRSHRQKRTRGWITSMLKEAVSTSGLRHIVGWGALWGKFALMLMCLSLVCGLRDCHHQIHLNLRTKMKPENCPPQREEILIPCGYKVIVVYRGLSGVSVLYPAPLGLWSEDKAQCCKFKPISVVHGIKLPIPGSGSFSNADT